MNYSLSASRNIGGYKQKIVVQLSNGGASSSASILTAMRGWCSPFTSIDPQDRSVGSFEYYNFIQTESNNTSNNGGIADVTVTMLSTTNGSNPKHTTFTVTGVTTSNMMSTITTAYSNLTGLTITNITEYLLTATIKLKKSST